jgi:hypothetical protein
MDFEKYEIRKKKKQTLFPFPLPTPPFFALKFEEIEIFVPLPSTFSKG